MKRISLNQFNRVIGMRPGAEREEKWKLLLIEIENAINGMSDGTRTIVQRPSGGGGGTTTGTGGFPGGTSYAPTPQAVAFGTIKVPYRPDVPLLIGSLVHLAARSIQLADCRDINKWANFAVTSISGGFVELSSLPLPSLPLRIRSGRGTSTLGTLYLYRDGTCTDEYTDIVGEDGMPVGGAQISQIVGASQFLLGPVPEGAIRASLSLQPPAVIV